MVGAAFKERVDRERVAQSRRRLENDPRKSAFILIDNELGPNSGGGGGDAPTHEQRSKFDYEPPALDQKVARNAYRRISQVEDLHRREDITYEQFRAAEKLNTHRLGAMGVKVQHDDDTGPLNADTEYPITYHNQKLAEARKAVSNPRIWDNLLMIIEESKSIVEIGRATGRKSHSVARAFALGRITSGLDALVDLWGLSTNRRQKVP